MTPHRERDGHLPFQIESYRVTYLAEDGGMLCAACANGENGSEI